MRPLGRCRGWPCPASSRRTEASCSGPLDSTEVSIPASLRRCARVHGRCRRLRRHRPCPRAVVIQIARLAAAGGARLGSSLLASVDHLRGRRSHGRRRTAASPRAVAPITGPMFRSAFSVTSLASPLPGAVAPFRRSRALSLFRKARAGAERKLGAAKVRRALDDLAGAAVVSKRPSDISPVIRTTALASRRSPWLLASSPPAAGRPLLGLSGDVQLVDDLRTSPASPSRLAAARKRSGRLHSRASVTRGPRHQRSPLAAGVTSLASPRSRGPGAPRPRRTHPREGAALLVDVLLHPPPPRPPPHRAGGRSGGGGEGRLPPRPR